MPFTEKTLALANICLVIHVMGNVFNILKELLCENILLLTALMHLMRTFIEDSLCLGILVMTRNNTCDLLLSRSRLISHKARDPKSTGRRQLLIVSPVITGVTTILFLQRNKKYAFKK